MVYKCNICGYVYDEEKERTPFSELTECPVCKNPPEQFILHTDYIFSISPDCRAPAKCINECKTVNPGGLQYKLAETEKTMVMQSGPETIYLCLARN